MTDARYARMICRICGATQEVRNGDKIGHALEAFVHAHSDQHAGVHLEIIWPEVSPPPGQADSTE